MANVGVYYVSHELEHPFGSNMNDLPMVDSMNWLNRGLSCLLDNEVQQPPKFNSGHGSRTMMFKISHSFADCHRKSMINMDAYDAVVHDFEDAYDLVGQTSQESRTLPSYMSQGSRASQQGCSSFSPTGRQSNFLMSHGRSLDSNVELMSMATRDIPEGALTHGRLEELQVAVDDRTPAENLERRRALTGGTAFAAEATSDAGRVPLLRSVFESHDQGLSHATVADAGCTERLEIAAPVKAESSPPWQLSGSPLQEGFTGAAVADAEHASYLQSSMGSLQSQLATATPLATGQVSVLQASSSPVQEGPAHAASANPSVRSSGESLHASSDEVRHVGSRAPEGDRTDCLAGLHT